jgi:dTDP-4-dehydrorhamnose 3,5-epimerase
MFQSKAFKKSLLEGVWLYCPKIHLDERGSTSEIFNSKLVPSNFNKINITQLLIAKNNKNVIRGLHFSRIENPQFKLINCVEGTILDVVIDLRKNSKTFGKHEIFLLDSVNTETLMIPNGFGHGYQVISEGATVHYALQTNFRFEDEFVINPFDPVLNIPWHPGKHILSYRDKHGANFDQYFK